MSKEFTNVILEPPLPTQWNLLLPVHYQTGHTVNMSLCHLYSFSQSPITTPLSSQNFGQYLVLTTPQKESVNYYMYALEAFVLHTIR